MRDGKHLLAEGPTGVGKSVAYGVPAVFHASQQQKRVVVATANIALQEQLVTKDLPVLGEVLPWPFTLALLKGRNNFLCRDKMVASEAQGEFAGFTGDELDAQIAQPLAWARKTGTGDVSEVPFVPAPVAWARFSVGADDCKSDGCDFRDVCFAEQAKAKAEAADILARPRQARGLSPSLRTSPDVAGRLVEPDRPAVLVSLQTSLRPARGGREGASLLAQPTLGSRKGIPIPPRLPPPRPLRERLLICPRQLSLSIAWGVSPAFGVRASARYPAVPGETWLTPTSHLRLGVSYVFSPRGPPHKQDYRGFWARRLPPRVIP